MEVQPSWPSLIGSSLVWPVHFFYRDMHTQLVTGEAGRLWSNAAVLRLLGPSVDQTERNNMKVFNGPDRVHCRHPVQTFLCMLVKAAA